MSKKTFFVIILLVLIITLVFLYIKTRETFPVYSELNEPRF